MIGSRAAMFVIATRPANFSGESKAPSGVDSLGNWTTMICSGMILLPIGIETLLGEGSVTGVANTLHISLHTVRNHLKSIFRKLGVHSQVELVTKLKR